MATVKITQTKGKGWAVHYNDELVGYVGWEQNYANYKYFKPVGGLTNILHNPSPNRYLNASNIKIMRIMIQDYYDAVERNEKFDDGAQKYKDMQ